MKKILKKSAVRAAFAYLLLTTGLWMFINSYSNSYNKLTAEKIAPASITVSEASAEMTVLENSVLLDLSLFMPESKLYCGLYILAADELRMLTALITLADKF